MASEESGGCGCAVVLALLIYLFIDYEIKNNFVGGISAWIVIGILIVIALVIGLCGAIISLIKDLFS